MIRDQKRLQRTVHIFEYNVSLFLGVRIRRKKEYIFIYFQIFSATHSFPPLLRYVYDMTIIDMFMEKIFCFHRAISKSDVSPCIGSLTFEIRYYNAVFLLHENIYYSRITYPQTNILSFHISIKRLIVLINHYLNKFFK